MKLLIIIGSIRPNRFSIKPATWIYQEAQKLPGVEVELVDLLDYPLPFYDEAMTPAMLKGNYTNEMAKKWAAKMGEGDGYIIVTPEYDHSMPAVLKNALDWVYYEWNKKPVGFVSFGSVGGARAVEQLRLVVVEVEMAPIKRAIHIPGLLVREMRQKPLDEAVKALETLNDMAQIFFEDLLWWTKALKTAREAKP